MYSFKLTQGADLAEGVVVDVRLPEPFTRFSIGRDPSNQWPIPDRTLAISARHCEIASTPNGPALRDVSTNGTFVNGATLRLRGSHLLRDGDRIALGPYQITVLGPKVAAARASGGHADTGLPMGGSASAGGRPPMADISVIIGGARAPAPAWRGGDPAAMLAQGAARAPLVGVTEILRHAAPLDEADVDVTRIRAAPPKAREAREGGDTNPARLASVPTPAPAPVPIPTPAPTPVPAVPMTEPMPLEVVAPTLATRLPLTWPAAAPAAGVSVDIPAGADATLDALAAGLGLGPAAWAGRDAAEVAAQVGALARAAVVTLGQLLQQQALSRRQIGSRAPALAAVRDVNPLRVAGSPEAALLALLAPGAEPQLPVQRAGAELAAQHDRLLAAFRDAAQRLGDELAPESLDAAVAGSDDAARANQRWALYSGLWQGLGLAPGQAWSQGFVEAALLHLGAAYDSQGKP